MQIAIFFFVFLNLFFIQLSFDVLTESRGICHSKFARFYLFLMLMWHAIYLPSWTDKKLPKIFSKILMNSYLF